MDSSNYNIAGNTKKINNLPYIALPPFALLDGLLYSSPSQHHDCAKDDACGVCPALNAKIQRTMSRPDKDKCC